MPEVIEFDFLVRQVKTMADHSVNLTLNLPEYNHDAAAQLIRKIDGFGRCALVFGDKEDDGTADKRGKIHI